MPIIAAFICGLVFGVGLVVSGMTDTTKVLGFLDIFGRWDPTLVVVMGAALAVALPGFALARRRPRPVLASTFSTPAGGAIDRPLIAGAVLFGVGWGLVGLCPGPAIANLATLSPKVIAFVIAMLAGMALHDSWYARLEIRRAAPADG